MKNILLKGRIRITKLDRRSISSFGYFSHKLDILGFQDAQYFINWGRENLGDFLPWNLFYTGKKDKNFFIPNWAIRYQSPGLLHTEIFLKEEVVPIVLLYWQE